MEELIKQHVIKELNISEEQFVAACQEESGNAYAKVLFDQVLAGDDFLSMRREEEGEGMKRSGRDGRGCNGEGTFSNTYIQRSRR